MGRGRYAVEEQVLRAFLLGPLSGRSGILGEGEAPSPSSNLPWHRPLMLFSPHPSEYPGPVCASHHVLLWGLRLF